MLIYLLLAVPLVTGALCRVLPGQMTIERVNLLGALATFGVGAALGLRVFMGGAVTARGDFFRVDALGALLILLIVVVGFFAACYSVSYLRHDVAAGEVPADQLPWYYLGYHIFILTMLLSGVVNNVGIMWAAIEATTIVSALLVGFYRHAAALEAAWKYLVLNSVGITFALFGILLTYYAAVHTLGDAAGLNWTTLIAHADRLDPGVMKVAFVFILIGFGTKAGFAPMHTWLPDAHSQAPTPISAVLSGVLLNCALYGILRFHLITTKTVGPAFSSRLLLGFGLLSVAVALPFLLVQTDVKRLLAYSSVEHIGLIAVAIGIGGPVGIYAALLHLVNHSITKALLFFLSGELVQRYGTRRIRAIRGVVGATPLLGSLLLIGVLAITGLPPFGMFVSELSIVVAGFREGYAVVTVVLIALLALIFTGIYGHFGGMVFGSPVKRRLTGADLGRTSLALFGVLALAITVLGLWVPPPLTSAIQQIVRLFTGGAA
jgi:hydrogenase-4 component F